MHNFSLKLALWLFLSLIYIRISYTIILYQTLIVKSYKNTNKNKSILNVTINYVNKIRKRIFFYSIKNYYNNYNNNHNNNKSKNSLQPLYLNFWYTHLSLLLSYQTNESIVDLLKIDGKRNSNKKASSSSESRNNNNNNNTSKRTKNEQGVYVRGGEKEAASRGGEGKDGNKGHSNGKISKPSWICLSRQKEPLYFMNFC